MIDFDNLRVRAPEMIKDLPAGGSRLEQRADGYLATIVSGEVTYQQRRTDGCAAGTPGALTSRLGRSVR